MTIQADLIVIGGGPAGLEAAATAADTGVDVVLIDMYNRPGGQYFKQLSSGIRCKDETPRQKEAVSLFRRFEKSGARALYNTLVWNVCPLEKTGEFDVFLSGPRAPEIIRSKTLVIGAGVYDRPVPFPGWTLPGVMTAGAVQIMLKTQRILPGRRFLLSGTGPLQLAVASQIIHAGGEVAGVLEASIFKPEHLRFLAAMWGQWSKIREGLEYWRVLRKSNVPLTRGRAAIRAEGQTQVEKVVTARLDDEMNPVPGTEQTVAADTLVLGYGFLPSNELTRLLGCRHQFIPEQMHYTPKRDAIMRTSVPGVYAVGDGAGVGGEKLARIEGRVAGLAVAGRLERMKPTHIHEAMGRLRKELYREQRFAGMLTRLFGVRPGMLTWAKDDTLICRCEEISKKEIMDALEVGCESPTWVKRMTRAGMGMCQGRVCGNWIAWLTAHTLEQDPADLMLDTVRPPLRPIPMIFSEVSDNG